MDTSNISMDEYILTSINELNPDMMFNHNLVQSKNTFPLMKNLKVNI